MNVLGIICEYNPFHLGHLHHIQTAKEQCKADAIVCVMSGNFVQRGQPAILDKWTRAAIALSMGADLVVDLPTAVVLQSAHGFALGAVALMDALNIVDYLSFGSESGDLQAIADMSNQVEHVDLKEEMKEGLSFAVARYQKLGSPALLSYPNNILATEYLGALRTLGSNIKPHTIKRYECYPSAHHIRTMVDFGKSIEYMVPPETRVAIELMSPVPTFARMESLVLYCIRMAEKEHLAQIKDMGDGLAGRVYSKRHANNLEELLFCVKTKRHALSRIRRALVNMVLENTFPQNTKPEYIRILGANSTGRTLLKRMKPKLPLEVKSSKLTGEMWEFETRATDVYALLTGGGVGMEYTKQMILG